MGDLMSIKFISNYIFDIYIKKCLIKNIDFNKKEDIEKYLKKTFKLLNNKYKVKIEGFYDITIYIDKYYGIILHLEKENIDYYDYYKNQVDMSLVTIDTNFLYEVDDIPLDIINKINVIVENNKIYVTIKEELDNLEMMNLIENSKIICKI